MAKNTATGKRKTKRRTVKPTKPDDPWVQKGDREKLNFEYAAYEKCTEMFAPFIVRLINVAEVRRACQADEIPDHLAARCVVLLDDAFRASLKSGPAASRLLRDHRSESGKWIQEFCEKILKMPHEQRRDCVHLFQWPWRGWEDPHLSTEWERQQYYSVYSSFLFQAMRPLLVLQWVMFNTTPSFHISKIEEVPRIGFGTHPMFRACWCFRCGVDGSFSFPKPGAGNDESFDVEVLPLLFVEGGMEPAIKNLREWRDTLCYRQARDAHCAAKPIVLDAWRKDLGGTGLDPVARWLGNPNEQNWREAVVFLRSIQDQPIQLNGGAEVAPPAKVPGDSDAFIIVGKYPRVLADDEDVVLRETTDGESAAEPPKAGDPGEQDGDAENAESPDTEGEHAITDEDVKRLAEIPPLNIDSGEWVNQVDAAWRIIKQTGKVDEDKELATKKVKALKAARKRGCHDPNLEVGIDNEGQVWHVEPKSHRARFWYLLSTLAKK